MSHVARRSARILGACVVVVMTACMPHVEQPEIKLDGIGIGGLGLQGGTLNVRLEVMNPNDFAMKARQLDWKLELADSVAGKRVWHPLAEDTYAKTLEVGPNDRTVVEIPVRFEYRDLESAVRSIIARGTFDYRVTGNVKLEEPLSRSIPFSRIGAVDLFD